MCVFFIDEKGEEEYYVYSFDGFYFIGLYSGFFLFYNDGQLELEKFKIIKRKVIQILRVLCDLECCGLVDFLIVLCDDGKIFVIININEDLKWEELIGVLQD